MVAPCSTVPTSARSTLPADANGAPLVSVIIDNYNYGHLLAQAIDSALGQTYPRVEVVVVDDGSTDGSREVIAGYGDRVVAVLEENGGQSAAFNAGFAASHGEVIAFLDADDVWAPDKLARVMAVFAAHPQVSWVGHKLTVTDGSLHSVGATFPIAIPHGLVPPDPDLYLERIVTVPSSGLALRRPLAERIFPIPQADGVWRMSADTYLCVMSGIERTWGYAIDEELGCYRRHQSQRYAQLVDAARMVERAAVVAEAFSRAWSARIGHRVSSSTIFKHRLVVTALRGEPIWSPARWRLLAAGLAQVAGIAPRHPRLALRQGAALGFAFLLPRLWTRRLLNRLGMVRREGA